MTINPIWPSADELELSVFGRGYGEAICVHLGNQDWVLVDSCRDPAGAPASLAYLLSLGLTPEVVRLVVATHWDDDHIQGISEIVARCPNARVGCSAALRRQDILAYVFEQEAATGALGSGLDELRSILRICRQRRTAVLWAKANLPLYPLPPGDAPTVVALSPSDDVYERSIESLIEAATQADITLPRRRYRAPEGPNGASVATSVRVRDVAVLLGADLETSRNDEAGWDAVLKYSKPSEKASAIKVPHHGSITAHHEGIWSELAADKRVAVLCPWTRGGRFLPMPDDLNRLKTFSDAVFLTATPSLVRAKKDRQLQRMIRRLHGERVSELRGWGQVRLRRKPGDDSWRVELSGDAVQV